MDESGDIPDKNLGFTIADDTGYFTGPRCLSLFLFPKYFPTYAKCIPRTSNNHRRDVQETERVLVTLAPDRIQTSSVTDPRRPAVSPSVNEAVKSVTPPVVPGATSSQSGVLPPALLALLGAAAQGTQEYVLTFHICIVILKFGLCSF